MKTSTKDKLELYNVAKERADKLGVPYVVSTGFFREKIPEGFALSEFNAPLTAHSGSIIEYLDNPTVDDKEMRDENGYVI